MKLEDEIKQKKFRNEAHKLGVNIIYTFNWMNYHHSDFLKKFGITPQQYNILRILRGMQGEPASIKLLRERMLDKMSDASRIVEKLRLKGLVTRNTNNADRRACDVVITPAGLEVLTQIDAHNDTTDQLFNALSEKEMQTLNTLLDALRGR